MVIISLLRLLPADEREYHVNGDAQGTTYHITYFAKDSLFTQSEADSILDKLDSSMSNYKT
ncbi:MAG TPA: hypothetical protein VLD19_10870, partial [Chitinophagaceae bacterium]|nr:hypothetical protein [Chitinophagaceae bacterium]